MCLCRVVSVSYTRTSLQSEVLAQDSKQKELYIIDFIQAQELKSLTHQNYNQNTKNKKTPTNKNQNKTQINNQIKSD